MLFAFRRFITEKHMVDECGINILLIINIHRILNDKIAGIS